MLLPAEDCFLRRRKFSEIVELFRACFKVFNGPEANILHIQRTSGFDIYTSCVLRNVVSITQNIYMHQLSLFKD